MHRTARSVCARLIAVMLRSGHLSMMYAAFNLFRLLTPNRAKSSVILALSSPDITNLRACYAESRTDTPMDSLRGVRYWCGGLVLMCRMLLPDAWKAFGDRVQVSALQIHYAVSGTDIGYSFGMQRAVHAVRCA
eukprot:59694-Rhodomonas_salina.1